jgi:acyl-CoA dehydrogenase
MIGLYFAVATLIGLAFRLRDPEHLLGAQEDLGITCALVPADLPGVEIGARHDPRGIPFMNGPTRGDGVFVPLDAIVGGEKGAGRGWRMLMESLSAGRSISLPSLSVGVAKLAARVVTAYAMVREQFDTPIGRFEGVEPGLHRRAPSDEAARRLTVARSTGRSLRPVRDRQSLAHRGMRDVVDDAMDVRAGAAIQRGPATCWRGTRRCRSESRSRREHLTRSMIIYGQGAIRCHPSRWRRSAFGGDLDRFDRPFGHWRSWSERLRAAVGLSGAASRARRPGRRGGSSSASPAVAAFALVSDASMVTLGAPKRRE